MYTIIVIKSGKVATQITQLLLHQIITPNTREPTSVDKYLSDNFPQIDDNQLTLTGQVTSQRNQLTSNLHLYMTRVFQNKNHLDQIIFNHLDKIGQLSVNSLLFMQANQTVIADIITKNITDNLLLVGSEPHYFQFANELVNTYFPNSKTSQVKITGTIQDQITQLNY